MDGPRSTSLFSYGSKETIYRTLEVLAVVVAIGAILTLSLYYSGNGHMIKASLSGFALTSALAITVFAISTLIYMRLKDPGALKQLSDSWVFRTVGFLFVSGIIALVATSCTLPEAKEFAMGAFTKAGALGLVAIAGLALLFYHRMPKAIDPVEEGKGPDDIDFNKADRQAGGDPIPDGADERRAADRAAQKAAVARTAMGLDPEDDHEVDEHPEAAQLRRMKEARERGPAAGDPIGMPPPPAQPFPGLGSESPTDARAPSPPPPAVDVHAPGAPPSRILPPVPPPLPPRRPQAGGAPAPGAASAAS